MKRFFCFALTVAIMIIPMFVFSDEKLLNIDYNPSVSAEFVCDCPELGITVKDKNTVVFPVERSYDDIHGLIYNSGKDFAELLASAEIGEECEKVNDDYISIKIKGIGGKTENIILDGGTYLKNGKNYRVSDEDYGNILRMCLQEKYIQSGIKCIDSTKRQFISSAYRNVFSAENPDGTIAVFRGDRAKELWAVFDSITLTYDDCFEYDAENMSSLFDFSSENEYNMYSCRFDSSRFCVYSGNCYYKIESSDYIDFVMSAINGGTCVFSDIAGTRFESAVNKLYLSGIVSGYDDSTFKAENPVTRAEIASIIYRLYEKRQPINNINTDCDFVDVPKDYWASKYIAFVQACAIADGYDDKSFKPANPVSICEAIKMLVCMSAGENCGFSWPDGYIEYAEKIGLTDGAECKDINAPCSRGNLAIMLDNIY